MHVATKYKPLKSILTASRLSVYDVLERLDDNDGLYSVTVRQKGSLDTCLRLTTSWQLDEEEGNMDVDDASSALTTGLFVGQYLLLGTILSHS